MGSSAGCAHAVNRVSVPFLWQAAKNIHRVKMKSGNRNSPGWLMWVQVPWRIALEKILRCAKVSPRVRALIDSISLIDSPGFVRRVCDVRPNFLKNLIDRSEGCAYTNVTGDAHRGAPITVL